MAEKEQKFKRKQIVVDKNFQFGLILKALIPLVVLALIAGIFMFWGLARIEEGFHFQSTNELIAMLSQKLGNLFSSSAELFGSLRFWATILLAVVLIIGSCYVVYIFLYLSHRIAGPILRFEKTLEEILKGNLKVKINLREKDEFKNTADSFNEMLDGLRERIKRIDQYNSYTRETIITMKEKASTENKAHFEKLEDLTKGIEESIHEFEFE